jgi:AcrR family transcriptional regulator
MTKQQNATALKILKAAQETFLEKGFEGASINDIADRAQINKSLIYHHFESKENLWRTIKTRMVEAKAGKSLNEIDFPRDSFKSFLTAFVTFRYEFYNHNPDIARLISWQRLEKNQDELTLAENKYDFMGLAPRIKAFQDLGQVRSELDPEVVAYFIMTSASMPFMDPPHFFKGKGAKAQKQQYLDSLIQMLYTALRSQNQPQKWIVK